MKITLVIYCMALIVALSCARAPQQATTSRSQQLVRESAAAMNAKDYPKAQALAAEATRGDPQCAEAWVGYGMASVQLAQTNRAREAYERALALYQGRHRENPSDADQVFQEFFVLSLLGRSVEAEAALKQARIDYPNDRQIALSATNFAEIQHGWKGFIVEPK